MASFFFFSSRRRHTSSDRDWSSDVCSSDLVRIYVQVPQAFSAALRPGLKVTFEMPQYPGQKFDATLVTTSNAMNASSRSMLVELQVDNADGKLLSDTYCRVNFQ